jgi:hypothetical protein
MGQRAKFLGAGMAAGVLALVLGGDRASADGPACSAWEVEYSLNGNMRLADTVMGAADGVYPVGPGRAVVRFEDHAGQPGGHARLVSYAIHEHVAITSKALFMNATVVTETNSHANPDGSGLLADGALSDHTLAWTGPMRAYQTDGTTTCDGSLCGKFGAPPQGVSPVHLGPRTVQPAPFQFGPDMRTFSMAYVQTAHSDSPKQTTYESVSGREMRRTCIP